MKRIALALVLLVGLASTGCGGAQRSSHPDSREAELYLGVLLVTTATLLLVGSAVCQGSCDKPEPMDGQYRYPERRDW